MVIGPPLKVNPVEPPLTFTEVTVPPAAKVVQVGVAPKPAEVRICPALPTDPFRAIVAVAPDNWRAVKDTVAAVAVPVKVGLADKTREPDPVAVATPVPPLATPRVPPKVNVPEVVTGLPVNVKPVVPPEAATEVTDPPPPAFVQVGVAPGPAEVRI